VTKLAGEPQQVVHALIDAANAAGGKDNITAVYVEGERFGNVRPRQHVNKRRGYLRTALAGLLTVVGAAAVVSVRPDWRLTFASTGAPIAAGRDVVVDTGGSIATALQRAGPGSTIVVEPGEYHERLILRSGVRLVSRVPRGATIRLPGGASEADPAVVAADITDAEFAGFRIVGDAATPLGTAVLISNSDLSIVDVEISGATRVAVDISGVSHPSLVASDIRDNPGAALAIRSGALPRIVHNVFIRNGLSTPAADTVVIEANAEPDFSGNIFHGIGRGAVGSIREAARSAFVRDNWFPDAEHVRPPAPRTPRSRGTP
jgi:hypothetical protein